MQRNFRFISPGLIVCLVIGLIVLPLPAAAQGNPPAIQYGDTVEGTLESGEEDTYTFDALEGDVAIATVTSPSLSLSLAVHWSSSTGSTEVQVERELTSDGSYDIVVRAADGSSTGAYTLTLQGLRRPPTRTLQSGQAVGEAWTVDQSPALWWFMGQAGQVIDLSIRFYEGWADYVDILDASGAVVYQEAGTVYDSRFAAPLAQDGLYTVRLFTTYDDAVYSLTLGTPAPAAQIGYGSPYAGQTTGELQVLGFQGSAGDSLRLRVAAPDLEALQPRITVGGPSSTLVYGYTSYEDMFEKQFVLVETGPHSLIVTTQEDGAYTLTLDQLERAPQPIAIGDSVSVVLDAPPRPVYQFQGAAGDRVSVDAVSDSFISETALGGPGGLFVLENSGSGVMAGTLLPNIVLPVDGLYTLTTGPYYEMPDSYFGYAYTLRLNPASEAGPLTFGESATGTLPSRRVALHTFEAQAGDSAGLWLHSDSFTPGVFLYGPRGRVAVGLLLSDSDSLIPTTRLPWDGVYTVIVESDSGLGQGGYTLNLTADFFPSAERIAAGDSLSGTLDAGKVIQFEAVAGDLLRLDKGGSNEVSLWLVSPRATYDYLTSGIVPATDDGFYTVLLLPTGEGSYDTTFALGITAAEWADGDGDGLPDRQDRCPAAPGDLDGCADTDGDGALDPDDLCPDETGTAQGCPDTDGDGLGDAADQCVDVPGNRAAGGCPDADGDGVFDADDACPAEPGLVALNGCRCTAAASGNANLRGGPGTTFDLVGSVTGGQTLAVIGQNAAGDWYKLQMEGIDTAWIAAFLVSAPACPAGVTLPVAE